MGGGLCLGVFVSRLWFGAISFRRRFLSVKTPRKRSGLVRCQVAKPSRFSKRLETNRFETFKHPTWRQRLIDCQTEFLEFREFLEFLGCLPVVHFMAMKATKSWVATLSNPEIPKTIYNLWVSPEPILTVRWQLRVVEVHGNSPRSFRWNNWMGVARGFGGKFLEFGIWFSNLTKHDFFKVYIYIYTYTVCVKVLLLSQKFEWFWHDTQLAIGFLIRIPLWSHIAVGCLHTQIYHRGTSWNQGSQTDIPGSKWVSLRNLPEDGWSMDELKIPTFFHNNRKHVPTSSAKNAETSKRNKTSAKNGSLEKTYMECTASFLRFRVSSGPYQRPAAVQHASSHGSWPSWRESGVRNGHSKDRDDVD